MNRVLCESEKKQTSLKGLSLFGVIASFKSFQGRNEVQPSQSRDSIDSNATDLLSSSQSSFVLKLRFNSHEGDSRSVNFSLLFCL